MSPRQLALGFLLFAACFWSVGHAQSAGVVTLRANRTTATGSLTPTLTWSTNPTAQSCTAGGGWSGTKAANGTQTLPTIRIITSYTLTCRWGNGTAVVRWSAPTANSDGSPLVNLASYKVVYGTSASALTQTLNVVDNTQTSATVQSLAPGRWYFAVRAVNTRNVESVNSSVGQKDVTGATASSELTIAISPTTPPPAGSLRAAARPVYDVLTNPTGSLTLGQQVGLIALGAVCDSNYVVTTKFYRVNRAEVTFSRTSRSTAVVARCLPQ